MNPSEPAIEAHGLARSFRSARGVVEAVRGIDFSVGRAEIVGFLGPNGAGKTTSQRMLSTLLEPTAGEARVVGCDLRTDPVGVRRRIGYVAQRGSTNPLATVEQELVLQAQLYGSSKAEARKRASALYPVLELESLETRMIRTLSGGQKRRLEIALGLIHEPELVFLDEPTTGLDPQTRNRLWEHIRKIRERGVTLFLTTHYLEEADALCDRILIIDSGRIVAEGTPDALKRRISGDLVSLRVQDRERALALLAQAEGARDVATTADGVRVTIDGGDTQALKLVRLLESAGLAVSALSIARPTLDDVFLTLTGRSLRDAPPEHAA